MSCVAHDPISRNGELCATPPWTLFPFLLDNSSLRVSWIDAPVDAANHPYFNDFGFHVFSSCRFFVVSGFPDTIRMALPRLLLLPAKPAAPVGIPNSQDIHLHKCSSNVETTHFQQDRLPFHQPEQPDDRCCSVAGRWFRPLPLRIRCGFSPPNPSLFNNHAI